MGTHAGKEGTVQIGANTVAEIRDWSVTEQMDPIEDTAMGDADRTYKAGLNQWTGQLTCWWDETDTTGQGALTVGASVTGNFYPEGAATGDTFYSGTMLVTEITRSAALDGMVEVSFNFQGSGPLTQADVS